MRGKPLWTLAAAGFCLLFILLGSLSYSLWKSRESQPIVPAVNLQVQQAAKNDLQGRSNEETPVSRTEAPSLWEKYEADGTWGDVLKNRKAKQKKKKKIYKVATELNLSHETLIEFLRKKGHEVKSHMSSVDDDMMRDILVHFKRDKDVAEKHQRKIQEIRDRKRAEEMIAEKSAQLERTNRELVALNAELDDFSNMAECGKR
jgi:acyl-CoA synthetase (NDP forming)